MIIGESFFAILSIVIGLLFGSFGNVLIARLPRRKSIVFPPSHCVYCQSNIRWFDNIPLISYLILRGRCRTCRKRINIRYPVVEALTSLLFFAAYMRFGFDWILILRHWPIVLMLTVITFIDLRHRIIPDELNVLIAVLGIATSHWVVGLGLMQSLLGAGIGFGFFYAIAWAYYKYSGQVGLGGGDIKLIGALGSLVGAQGVIMTILLASIIGSIVGIAMGLLHGRRKRRLMRTAIPFGPFLVLGSLCVYFFGESLWPLFTTLM